MSPTAATPRKTQVEPDAYAKVALLLQAAVHRSHLAAQAITRQDVERCKESVLSAMQIVDTPRQASWRTGCSTSTATPDFDWSKDTACRTPHRSKKRPRSLRRSQRAGRRSRRTAAACPRWQPEPRLQRSGMLGRRSHMRHCDHG